ncbi:hypothetical protein [Spirosoma flavum]|uniref:Long-chain fatty acid transport protein n=1 Tax=Spirosoma flavum TaxID=2048557 RepID=A0ABW6AJ41_9BACT
MKTRLVASIFLCLVTVCQAQAQDANYWQANYGPGGYLTPGAVVAYDNNQGFFYVNPALMAINPKTSVSLSANVYQADLLTIKDGVGSGKNLQGISFKINPQMISGTIAFKENRTIALGYALLHNPVLNYQTTQRQDKQMPVLADSYSPGDEYYVGQYAAHNRISQTTAAGAIGVKLSSRWSIGLTAEGQIRTQDFYEQYSSRALVNTPDASVLFPPLINVESSYQAVYWHVGLRIKGGISYDAGAHHIGLVLSSPMLSLKGRAVVTSDLVVSNLHVPDTSIETNLLANGRQTNLPVTYKMPLSIAAGYAVDFEKLQLYLAGEYFLTVPAYNLITPGSGSFIRPDTGSNRLETTELLQLKESRKGVLNVAVGSRYFINPAVSLIGSLRTDFSYNTEDKTGEYKGQVPNINRWNNYHAQLGGTFKRRKFNLRAGLLLTYGQTATYQQPVNFDNPTESSLMLGEVKPVKASFFSTGLLLAYIHNL